MVGHLLCDLDGTLIDSAEGILESLRLCLNRAGIESRVNLSTDLLGLPLRALLGAVIDSDDPLTHAEIDRAFRHEYDERGFLSARPYPGIPEALGMLAEGDIALHLVTNKRLAPTLSILGALGWSGTFSSIDTLDSSPGASTKTDVVEQILQRLRLPLESVALVGDSVDDAHAARDNGVTFAWASWGYGAHPTLRGLGVELADAGELARFGLGESAG